MMSDVETRSMFETPRRELVAHAVRELSWDERFQLAKMSATHGNSMADIYSFPQLVNEMFSTRWDRLLLDGSKASLVWMDFTQLVAWLRDVIGDVEFADAIETTIESEEGYHAQIDAITPLFRERVAQYRAVLDAAEGTDQ